MASEKKPPAPDGPDGAGGGSSVRRAVSLGSAAADPGPMLAPAARRTAEPEPEQAPESGTAAPERSATGEAETTAAAPAPAAEERPEAEGRSAAEAEAAHGVGATAAAGAGADEPPSGNPKKPLLAAAGIAGVVLLAVPLLIWATDDARQKKDDVTVAAGSDTLLEEEPLEVPKGDYAPAEPTPEPSTEKPSAKPSAVAKKPAPVVSSAPVSSEPVETKKAETRVKEHKAPQLPPNTAAYAVQRMAASHPGRHICYRVHVKGAGWTAPVCDGATAGHEGSGRPITAINIAVADAKRVNGNEFIQKDGWTTPWSGAADGTDLTLGGAASNAPNLSGFTIGVESGNVCQNNKLGEHGWGGLACEQPQGWIFGGSTDPKVWLEAVRFTV
ncbi:hypothetical protein [Streptomyces sp. NRRL WC-3626]|uniref:hypothetical protein n=1 Tax=Streptomyces sp. NRRL WC-3626 TaxID=1463926 RepID=UPI000691A287|nr:hypothetical protein [Streptomyces sp. NRRL WC-3626]